MANFTLSTYIDSYATSGLSWSGTNTQLSTINSTGVTLSTNATGWFSTNFSNTALPTNFVKILTLKYNLTYSITPLTNDTESMWVRVFKDDGVTALTDEMFVVTRTSAVGSTTTGETSFTGVDLNATREEWNACRLQIRVTHSANMGSDGSQWFIDQAYLSGTYQSTPNAPTLTAPTAGATNQSVTPTLSFNATDPESDTLEYEVQIDTVNTFDNFVYTDQHAPTTNISLLSISNSSGNPIKRGQSFTGDGNKIIQAIFRVRKFVTPTGGVTVSIFAHSGTFGTSSVGIGSELATSEAISASTLLDTFEEKTFTFPTPFQTVAGTKYVVVVEYSGTVTNNYIQIEAKNTEGHGGNHVTYNGTTWTADVNYDTWFKLLGSTLITANSIIDAGFTAGHPFASGASVNYTVGRFNSSYAYFYDGSATNGGILHSVYSKAGQSFIGNGKDLKSATFLLHREGSPTGNILCRLYAHTGTYGDYATSRPTGEALATVTIDVATIPTSGNGDYTFTFDTPYPLVDGTPYYMMLEYSGGDSSNLIRVYATSTNPTSGNKLTYYVVWTGSNTEDYYLKILTDEPIELAYETTYYWRTRAIDPLGSNTYGAWATTRSFTTIADGIQGTINGSSTTSGVLIGKGRFLGVSNTVTSTTGVLAQAVVIGVLAGRSDSQWRLTTIGNIDLTLINSGVQRFGQILNNFSGIVDKIGFTLKKTGSPVFDIVAKIYSISGGLPDAVLQTSSTTISTSSITETDLQYYFQFDKITNYSQNIHIGFEITNHVSSNLSNRVFIKINDNNALYQGLRSSYNSGVWSTVANEHQEFDLILIGDTEGFLIGKSNITGVTTTATTTQGILIGKVYALGVSNTTMTTAGILKGKGSIVSVINPIASTVSVLNGKGRIIGAINPFATTAGIIKGTGRFLGVTNTSTTTVSVLKGSGSLGGASNSASTTVSVLLNGTVLTPIDGVINGIATTASILTARGIVQATINVALTVSGVLNARGYLVGVSTNTATLSGLLNSNLQGSVIVNTTTNTFGILTGKGRMLSVVSGIATTQSVLILYKLIYAESFGVAIIIGTLQAKGTMAQNIYGSATTTGVLTSKGLILGEASQAATTSGVLSAKGSLSATVNASANLQGSLSSDAILGIINNIAIIIATLKGNTSLSASSNVGSSTSGVLNSKLFFVGASNGSATLFGLLNSNLQGSVVVNTTTITFGILTAKGNLAGLISNQSTEQGDVKGKGLLQSVTNAFAYVFGTVSAYGKILGTINGTSTVSVLISAKGTLSSVITNSATTFGIINSNLLGSVIVNTTTITFGTLNAIGNLLGNSYAGVTSQGILYAKGSLSGTVNGIAITFAIIGSDAIAVTVNGSGTTQGVLQAKGILNGTSSGIALVQGLVGSKKHILGTSSGQTTTSSLLKGKGLLLGESNGVISVSATLRSKGMLAANTLSQSILSGNLTANGSLSGGSQGTVALSGTLTTDEMNAVSNAVSSTQGILTAIGSLSGESNGSSEAYVIPTIKIPIEGVSNGLSQTSGVVSVTGYLNGSTDGSSVVSGTLIPNYIFEEKCLIRVIYKDIIYNVSYINTEYVVKYADKNYYVNYHCKKEAS